MVEAIVDVRGCDFSGLDLTKKVLSGVRMQVTHAAPPAPCWRAPCGGMAEEYWGRRGRGADTAASWAAGE